MTEEVTRALELYTLEEILEQAGVTVEETLQLLLDMNYITLPEIEPLE